MEMGTEVPTSKWGLGVLVLVLTPLRKMANLVEMGSDIASYHSLSVGVLNMQIKAGHNLNWLLCYEMKWVEETELVLNPVQNHLLLSKRLEISGRYENQGAMCYPNHCGHI